MKNTKQAVAALMLMAAVVCAAGCRSSKIDGSFMNHDYVDLGLPSGTLWATCNVGANVPEEYGDYFAWGETRPKSEYSWENYKYCKGEKQYTKYCCDSDFGFNGFTDNLTVLQPEDDAATVNWGNGWCMPTDDQWKELLENTRSKWAKRKGIVGRLFIASNGKSLFLPAAGTHSIGSNHHVAIILAGERGFYLSRSLVTEITSEFKNAARVFDIRVDRKNRIYFDRYRGNSVRPVRSAN